MNWSGKLIGGALGMLAFGPVGAAIGAVIGHQFDSGAIQPGFAGAGMFGSGPDPRLVNQLFFPDDFSGHGHIAKSDGRVSEQEIASARAVMQALHLQEAQVQAAIGYLAEGKQAAYDLTADLRRLRSAIAVYPELAYFLHADSAAGGAGRQRTPAAAARAIEARRRNARHRCRRFRSPRGHAALSQTGGLQGSAGAGHGPFAGADAGEAGISDEQRLTQAYRVLAAEPAMSDEEVVKCYRRQMSRHHPDKLKANGLPDSMLERAKEEAQEIQAAYEADPCPAGHALD